MKKEIKKGLSLKGKYKIVIATIKTPYQKKLNSKIEQLREQGKEFLHLVEKLNSICETKVIEVENLIPTTGLSLITNNLTDSSPTNDPQINYCAVGSGTTAPTLADTTLETETYRNAVASQTNSGGNAYCTMFISASEDDGTYEEFGLFADASGVADSGVLVSRSLISITKTALQTLTVDYQLNITNS